MSTVLGTQPRVTVGDWEAVSERLALSACPTYIAVSELVTHRVALRVSAVLLLRVWNPVRDCVNGRSGVGVGGSRRTITVWRLLRDIEWL